MEKIENKLETHEQMLERIVFMHFGENPKKIERMTTGLCNEVYEIELSDKKIIVRLSLVSDFMKGSHKHIPLLKEKGVKVPNILAEDYSKSNIPYSYQILSKLEGKDLGLVIENLSDDELNEIAKDVSRVMSIVRTIPSADRCGYFYDEYEEASDTWDERMKQMIHETMKRGEKTGVMDEKMRSILEKIYNDYEVYFKHVSPVTYIDDICSKNVMIASGIFSGIVDLDCLAQGDYLETIGRIKASWPGTHYGKVYTEAVMRAQNLNDEQRKMVSVYALLNRIAWACENGIQFNQNTTAVVDQERLRKDKEAIDILSKEYQEGI